MRVRKKQTKGKIVFALLLAMLVTLIQPVSSYADELDDGTAAETVGAEDGSDESGNEGDDSAPVIKDEPESEDKDEVENDEKDSEPEESEGTVEVVKPDGIEEPDDDSTFSLRITFTAWDENGEYHTVYEVTKRNLAEKQTLKEMGITLPETRFNYGGLTQTGWKDEDGREITEDTKFSGMVRPGREYQWNISAQYDKNYIRARYVYPGQKGVVERLFAFEQGEVFGNILKQIKGFVPDDISEEYSFAEWECHNGLPYGENEEIQRVIDYPIIMYAKVAEGTWIQIVRNYYDQKGNWFTEREPMIAEEGLTISGGYNLAGKSEQPPSYEGLRFKGWFPGLILNGSDPVKSGDSFLVMATYENCLVRYVINTGDEERIFCQVADRGETVTAMTTFEGLGEVTWDEGKAPKETFVVNDTMTFTGSAEVIEKPAKPSNPSKPSGSTSGSGSGDTKYPDKNLGTVVGEINSSAPGQTVQVNMNSWTAVPTEILQAAKGKDVNVVLVMDGYSWTINGKDIQTIYNRDRTDLKVTKNTNNIPGSTVTAIAGSNPSMQISLAHEGDFGFKATLRIGVGSEYAGKYGNLYYHDKNGKLVFIDAGQIDSEGNVSLVFSHASDYLLVISDQAMSQANVPENLKPAGTNQNGAASATNTNSNVTRSPKTGDYTMLYPWLLLCAAAVGAITIFGPRRRAGYPEENK